VTVVYTVSLKEQYQIPSSNVLVAFAWLAAAGCCLLPLLSDYENRIITLFGNLDKLVVEVIICSYSSNTNVTPRHPQIYLLHCLVSVALTLKIEAVPCFKAGLHGITSVRTSDPTSKDSLESSKKGTFVVFAYENVCKCFFACLFEQRLAQSVATVTSGGRSTS
jgi:hypothetical protein